MDTVTLKNNTARAIPIVLDHPAFRNRKSGFKRRAQPTIAQARDGTRTTKLVQREEPGSITLPAKGSVSGLHPAIKHCSQVRTLLTRRVVTIVAEQSQALQEDKRPRRAAARRAGPPPQPAAPVAAKPAAPADDAAKKGDD